MRSWQLDILDKMSGFKPGEMMVMTAGRNIGKSMWTAQAIDRLTRDLMNLPIEELVLSEGRVYGARYYCVEPVGGVWREMESWATETYGTQGSIWSDGRPPASPVNERWYMNNRKFWFRNEADRTMFVLRWS